MVEEVRKTQLLLEVTGLGRQQLCLKAQEQRVIILQWKRVVVGKVKEQMEQLPLEVVKIPEWRVLFSCVKKQRPLSQAKAPPQKRRAVMRVGSAETQDFVSAPEWIEEEHEEKMEELSFIPIAVSDPRWALHMCDNECREESFKFCYFVANVTQEGEATRTINLRRQSYNVRQAVGSILRGTLRAQNVGTFHSLRSVGHISLGTGKVGDWQQETPCK